MISHLHSQSRASTGYEPLFYALNWDKWLTITDMTDSKLDEVKDDRKLKGKTNFVSWKREFERASKADDIFEYLTGEEVVPPKPKKQDYFGKTIEVETRRHTRAMSAQAQFATPSSEG